eukprot:1906083-Rhodomonas_salina.1
MEPENGYAFHQSMENKAQQREDEPQPPAQPSVVASPAQKESPPEQRSADETSYLGDSSDFSWRRENSRPTQSPADPPTGATTAAARNKRVDQPLGRDTLAGGAGGRQASSDFRSPATKMPTQFDESQSSPLPTPKPMMWDQSQSSPLPPTTGMIDTSGLLP